MIKRTPDLIQTIHDYGLDEKNREIYLTSHPDGDKGDDEEPGVEFIMATTFIKNIRYLSASGNNSILIHLKSCGGYWEEGMAIYDAIKACPCHVVVLSYTHARSMSSIILQAADQRVLMPSSYFLYHEGDLVIGGIQRQVESNVEWSKRCMGKMLDIYADKMKNSNGKFCKWSIKRIKDKLNKDMATHIDVYLTPQETIDYGLADSIFDGDWETIKGGRNV